MRHRDRILEDTGSDSASLDNVFAALFDAVRRVIIRRPDGAELLVSGLAGPFDISLQAVSRHFQVLARAGLFTQERTERVSRCRLDTGPILTAAVWISRCSRYWQEQFDSLVTLVTQIERAKTIRPSSAPQTSHGIGGRRGAR